MSESIQLPALLDVVQPQGSKICPIMGPQIQVMPVSPSENSLLMPNAQKQSAFVRHYSPCVKEACQWWDDQAKDCRISVALALFVDRSI